MRINWVFANAAALDPTVDLESIKNIGPSWGGWRTWRTCGTDNVICHDINKARDLLQRAFQAVCNFYIPKNSYQDLGRPLGAKLYDGEFKEEVNDIEDIVAMHLAASQSDIILLVGFDLCKPVSDDKFEEHKIKNRLGLIHSVISKQNSVQWVLIDHKTEIDKAYQNLDNLSLDTLANALTLLD